MGRIIIPTLGLVAAVGTAILFGIVAHDDLGIAIDAIRNGALTSAGVIFVVVACGTLLCRSK
jgi:hypothetical protein